MAIHVQRNVVFVTSSIFAATAAGTLVVYSVLSSKTKLLGDTCLPIVGRFPELYKTETKIPTDNVSVVTRIHHNYRRYSVPFQHFSFKLINLPVSVIRNQHVIQHALHFYFNHLTFLNLSGHFRSEPLQQ